MKLADLVVLVVDFVMVAIPQPFCESVEAHPMEVCYLMADLIWAYLGLAGQDSRLVAFAKQSVELELYPCMLMVLWILISLMVMLKMGQQTFHSYAL